MSSSKWEHPIQAKRLVPYYMALAYSGYLEGYRDVMIEESPEEAEVLASGKEPYVVVNATLDKKVVDNCLIRELETDTNFVCALGMPLENAPSAEGWRKFVPDALSVILCGHMEPEIQYFTNNCPRREPKLSGAAYQETDWVVHDENGVVREDLPKDTYTLALLCQALVPAQLIWAKALSEAEVQGYEDMLRVLKNLSDFDKNATSTHSLAEPDLEKVSLLGHVLGVDSMMDTYFKSGLPLADVLGGAVDTRWMF